MKRLIAAGTCLALAGGTPAIAQQVPAYVAQSPLLQQISGMPAGGWAKVNANLFQDVWTPADLRSDTTGYYPFKIIMAWSSYAWDPNRGDLLIYGGGHANYSGNDVYRWRSRTLRWERASLPSEVKQFPGTYAYLAVDGPDNAPSSAHTYDNNIFLPIVDRFLTFGGALYNTGSPYLKPSEANPSQLRITGPYLFDPNRADGNKVGGSTGSHVQKTGPHPEIVGGRMWSNRDLARNLPNRPLPGTHVNGCTAYAQENGHDVVYVAGRPGQSTNLFLYRYEVVNLAYPAVDRMDVVGSFWDGPSGQTSCGYDAQKRLLVRIGNNSVPFVYWDLATPGENNRDRRVDITPELANFQQWLAANHLDLGNCAMDFDPVRDVHLVWCGAGVVWALRSPAANVTYGWSIRPLASRTAQVPPGDVGTGILGKWKYIPYFDVFIGLMNANEGNIWVYKPIGWQGAQQGQSGGSGLSIAIAAPSAGAVVTLGSSVTVAASALTSDGTAIGSVDFFVNGTRIATDVSSPYAVTWTPAAAGAYTLTARATDSKGEQAQSAAVSVIVDAPPKVAVTAPLAGTILAVGGRADIAAAATDADGAIAKVQFFVNGARLGEASAAPYKLPWTPLQAGQYHLVARAVDNRGVVTTSAIDVQAQYLPRGQTTVVLQLARNGYGAMSDVSLDAYNPGYNLGQWPELYLLGSTYTTLIRFGIFASQGGPVPDGATVDAATLEIYKQYYNYIYRLHPMLVPWDEGQANWWVRRTGVSWRSPGATAVGADYSASYDAQYAAGWDPGWMRFDVSARVRQYAVGGPNYGWRLVGVSGYAAWRRFASSENADASLRPRLTVVYR